MKSESDESHHGTGRINRPRLLIEEWLPIAKISVSRVSASGRPMTALPGSTTVSMSGGRDGRLVASRAAILASLLPADADQDKFLHMLGIHGDPVAVKPQDGRGRKEHRLSD